MSRPFEDFYIFLDNFSVPSLDLSGYESLFIVYGVFMLIPMVIGVLLKRIDLLPILFGMGLVRLIISPIPIFGVFIALYLWWRDMKLCLFTEKVD